MRKFGRTTALVLGLALAVAAVARMPLTRAIDGSEKAASDRLIVHEWGTFTSFSGSNGVQLDFRPLVDVDLPEFVFDRSKLTGEDLFSKARVRARVRMETPVTYFYTNKERTVRASVAFPEGLLTEFYPPVASMTPESNPLTAEGLKLGNGKLDWGEIHLIPTSAFTPSVKDGKTKSWLRNIIEQRVVPFDIGPGNHYYHARETDSAFVHVRHEPDENKPFKPMGDFIEKFLFYRGVGKFEQPLKVVVAEDGGIQVTNSCKQTIRSLIRVTINEGALTVSELDKIGGDQTVEFPKAERAISNEELQQMMVKALVGEQLYEREALAMVRTWADSWFAEEGTRIFYMVPRETTDRLLPLTITPTPDETVRVLVGRVEVMSPTVEKQLLEIVRLRSVQRATIAARNAEAKVRAPIDLPIPSPLKKLGRLAEPALVRLRQLARDGAVSNEAAILMEEIRSGKEEKPDDANAVSKN